MKSIMISYLNIPKYLVVFPSILEIQSCINRKTRKLGTSPRYWRQGRLSWRLRPEYWRLRPEYWRLRPEYWRQGRDTGDKAEILAIRPLATKSGILATRPLATKAGMLATKAGILATRPEFGGSLVIVFENEIVSHSCVYWSQNLQLYRDISEDP
ncbi:hypothetical protein E3N88_00473 [Mikania micrantha]|uniref:Uncharacterized protein n=1 Tax=Mikania micrantha TaxID=192012 RepID=A0A5N6PZM0_9ASTR|nr:hypothetical protein E3N88_00473 [Mikania micrantha]